MTVPLHQRADLAAGAVIDGPAIILEDQTSTYLTAAFRAIVAANGNIVINRKEGQAT